MIVDLRTPVQLPEDAELGQEFLLRVRLVEKRVETIEITAFGDVEPQVVSGAQTGDVVLLAVRATT